MCLVAPEDKSDSPITCASTTKVPDRDGVRFCRVCQAFKPVSIFPAGPRRFVCRTYFWERQGETGKLLLFTNPRKRAVICLWKRLYEDSRTLGLSLALTQATAATTMHTHTCVSALRCQEEWMPYFRICLLCGRRLRRPTRSGVASVSSATLTTSLTRIFTSE